MNGFLIERRRMFWLPVTAGALLAGIRDGRADGGALGWKEFLDAAEPLAKSLHRDNSRVGQDVYLTSIAALAIRVSATDVPRAKVRRFGKMDPPVEFGVSHRGSPFFVVEWRLAPNAVLPPHNHPNASVCTIGLEGEARLRKFELAGAAPSFDSRERFEVREMSDEVVAPGRVITLSAHRDNIHGFTAGKNGARGIDISSYHGPDVGFSFLAIDEKPLDTTRRTFGASWTSV